MKTITTEELKTRLDGEGVALFDVRGDVKYEIGHIPGAKSTPLGSLVFRVVRIMNPDSLVVVYSAGGDCDLAVQAARRLENHHMTNVQVYKDGLAGWEAAGHEVIPSPHAKLHTQGEVQDCRSIVVDRDKAYGGAFKGKPTETEAAGG
jgi:rhodanese-related sulfurtransferase